MSGWTESMLRSAASWKAFKEGKAMLDAGAVADAAMGASGWKGSVRQGKRMFRVSVTAKSVTDVETRCACPENQATGTLCAHAVAVALSAFSGGNRPGKPASPTAVAVSNEITPYEILLPENWRESISRAKLAASLLAVRTEPDPADTRLAEWLTAQASGFQGMLHLSGNLLASFLDAISAHPRVLEMKSRQPIALLDGARLDLHKLERKGDEVTLVPQEKSNGFLIANSAWELLEDETSLIRLGSGELPGSWIARLVQGLAVTLPVTTLLDNLESFQQWLHFPENNWLETLHFVPEPATVELHLDGSLSALEARLLIRYGDAPPVLPEQGKVVGLPRLDGERCFIRDREWESSTCRRLKLAGFQTSNDSSERWTLRGEDAVAGFISRFLPEMESEWNLVASDRFVSTRKRCVTIQPKIEIFGSGEDWMSFNLKFESNDGSEFSIEEVRRLLRSSSGMHRKKTIISNEVKDLIEPLFSELDLSQESGSYRASLATREVVLNLCNKINKNQKKNELSKNYEYLKPASIHANLREYQQHGSAWIWDRLSRFGGALLADDMGLGKTIQAIDVIERLFSSNEGKSGLILVVATASLLGNWKAEFARFAPARGVKILHGAGRDRERNDLREGEVILTSYSTLARDLAWHLRQEYRAVVVDEASLMRNPDTDHAKALFKLNAGMRLALTGTPVENGVRDLWSIFRFVQPGWLGSREVFRNDYEQAIQVGDSFAMERLRLRISPFMLRRTKEQAAPELPSKIMIDEFCDLSREQQSVYRDLLAEGRKRVEVLRDSGNQGAARMQVLTALLRLRQACCDLALLENERFNRMLIRERSSKIQRLTELLEEAILGGHKILVFSQFAKQLREIEKCVKERDWACLKLDGQTKNRQDLVDRFQSEGGPPIFLISLKAGGYGLNLTAADIVVHFDPWWNPAAEAQATDRAHRIGQNRPVTVYRLLARGTVEEKVVSLQRKKREQASSIDESGTGEAPGWSTEDMAEVLR